MNRYLSNKINMFLKYMIKLIFFSFIVKDCSASVSQELLLLDTTLIYQIANTDANLIDIRHLIGNLIVYKVHLSKLIYELVSNPNLAEEYKQLMSNMKVPNFLKEGLDLYKLKTTYNLSDQQMNEIDIEIARIWMNWDQLKKLLAIGLEFNITKSTLPFFLIKKSGSNLAKLLENATHDQIHDMLIEFSTYYYFLGKVVKNLIKGDIQSITYSKELYDGEKPEFLKKFVQTSSLMYTMHLSFSESKTVRRWIKRISARWFTFLSVYEKKLGLIDAPNFGNLNLLKETDDMLATRIKTCANCSFEDLIEDLKKFHEYLSLIMRRNYKYRQIVIEEARKYYKDKEPLFLRKISDIDYFQTVMKINNLQFFTVRHYINQINNKWPFLIGTKAEYTRRPIIL